MNERAIFEAALEIQDPAARRAYLDNACTDNPDLRRQVETLLESHETAGSFLDMPAVDQLHPGSANVRDRTLDFSPPIDAESDSDSSDDPISLDFLQPSTKPGSIGTLAHYEVLQVLGQGGFGIVLKAFDKKLHRLVAIKAMNPQLAATSPPRKRFLREARSAAAIKHENIVQVYSVEEQPLPYLVMEYIDGQTLQQKMDSAGPLEVPEVLHIGRQIASGLAAAHAMGLIHRDIKPGNILLEQDPDQKVKITDFGLARAADDASMTRTGLVCGTPMYMAPEQAQGQTLDHRADLFSFGSVLYQMVCGRPPFRAPTTVAVLRRVSDDTPRPLQEILPEIPDWLVVIVAKLHAKHPDERFQSAKEVADLLARCQSELQLNGKVTSVAEVARQACTSAASDPSTGTASENDAQVSTERPIGRPITARSSRRRIAVLAGVGLLLAALGGGILFGGQIFRLVTNQGELVIEVDDKNVDVKIVQNGIVVQDKTSQREFTLTAGKGEIEVLEQDGIKLSTREFELTRGGQTTVKVTLQDLADARLPQPNAKPPTSIAPDLSASLAPSPFDALRREDIPPYELAMAGGGDPAHAPPELVAVVGDSRLRHWQAVTSIVFTPDGKSLITSSADHTARIWDATTGQQTQVFQTDDGSWPLWLALNQNGKTLVLTNSELSKIWDLPNGEERQELKFVGASGGSLSKDGSLLLSGGGGEYVNLTELSTGKIVRLAQGHYRYIRSSALSPDGTLAAVAGDSGDLFGVLKLFTVADGKEVLDLHGHKSHIYSLSFSPDGRTLAAGADEGLTVWDVQTGKEQQSFADPGIAVFPVAFSANGKHLAACIWGGIIRIWDTETSTELPTLTVPGGLCQFYSNEIRAIAFSPDGKTLAVGMNTGIIRIWDLATGTEQTNFPGHEGYTTSLAVSPSGDLLATGSDDATVRLVNVPSLQERFRFEAEGSIVNAVTFGRDSQTLFAGTSNGGSLPNRVLAWGLAGGKLGHVFEGHRDRVICVAVSPDGQTLMSGDGSTGVIKCWDVPAGVVLEQATTHNARLNLTTTGAVSSLAFAPDGTMLATNSDDLKLWDIANGKELRVFKRPQHGPRSLAFSPDGTLLAESAPPDIGAEVTKVWEVATGEEYAGIPILSLAVAFGPGHKLYTAGPQGTVQIWDMTKQGSQRLEKEIRIGPPGGWIEQLVLSPDGRHLLTRNYNGTTYVLRLSAPSSAP